MKYMIFFSVLFQLFLLLMFQLFSITHNLDKLLFCRNSYEILFTNMLEMMQMCQ